MIFKNIRRFFETGTCLCCGCFRNTDIGLCDFCCERVILSRQTFQTKKTKDQIAVRSLVDWIPGESDELSAWLLSLKISSQAKWDRLAQHFVQIHIENLATQPKNCLLIPCPSRQMKRDHAQKWAAAIKKMGFLVADDVLQIEKNSKDGQQKKKRLFERRSIAMGLSEKFSEQLELNRFEKIIFLDDIVTTGSTAWAAYVALGKPEYFEVWCIGHRRSLRQT